MTGCGGHIGAQREELVSWPEIWHQNELRWQQFSSSLALSSLEAHVETEGSFSWRGIERLQYSTYDGQLALQFDNPHRWIVMSQEVSCGSLSSLIPDGDLALSGSYCPGTYGQLMELPESCMSRISVSMGVFPTRRMKKSWEMRLAGTARRAGRRRSRRPKR